MSVERDYGVTALTTMAYLPDIFIGLAEAKEQKGIIIADTLVLKRGAMLATKREGTVVTPTVGTTIGTGNGVLTMANPAYGTGVQDGSYKVVIIEGTVDAVQASPYVPAHDAVPAVEAVVAVAAKPGTFQVEMPDGTIEATGKIGTAYNKTIKFTLADGSANFIAGDEIEIDVAISAGDGFYYLYDDQATNGLEDLKGILEEDIDCTNGSIISSMYVTGQFNKDALSATRTVRAGTYNGGCITIAGEI